MGYNCKHGVAAGLHWLYQQVDDQSSAQQATVNKLPDNSLTLWLTQLDNDIAHQHAEVTLEPGRHYLLYQLELHQNQHRLLLFKAYLKKNGEWSQRKPYVGPYYATWNLPEFYLPQDSSIMQQIQPAGMQPVHNLPLTGVIGAQVLDQLLASQRLILADERALQPGQRRTLSWQWQSSGTAQRLVPMLKDLTAWQPIAVTPPYYIDTVNAAIGEITTPLTGAELAHLYAMPPVPNEQMAKTAAQLRRVFTPKQLPLPEEPQLTKESTPIPRLTLAIAKGMDSKPIFGVRVYFDYGPIVIPFSGSLIAGAKPSSLLETHNGQSYLIERDPNAESDYLLQLQNLELWPRAIQRADTLNGFWALSRHHTLHPTQQWQQFTEQAIPELVRQGWRINEAPDYKFEIHDASINIELQDQHNNWFDFSLGLQAGDITLDTMGVIGAWSKADMPEELMLSVGEAWLRIDTQPLWTIRDLLQELFNKDLLGSAVSLPGFQAAQFQNLELNERHDGAIQRLQWLANDATAQRTQCRVTSLSTTRTRLAGVFASLWPRRHLGRRHGLGQNHPDLGFTAAS